MKLVKILEVEVGEKFYSAHEGAWLTRKPWNNRKSLSRGRHFNCNLTYADDEEVYVIREEVDVS